jgi:hypothetical protein
MVVARVVGTLIALAMLLPCAKIIVAVAKMI